jgi:nucleoside-diphosphate-sugar epimerase
VLLEFQHEVIVCDNLSFGGESLLAFWHNPRFRFVKGDVSDSATLTPELLDGIDAVVHLAGVVGYPACKVLGKDLSWRYNVEGTKLTLQAAERAGAKRFVFASTYSNYGVAPDGQPVTEESPLFPQSIYAETKIACEQYLQSWNSECVCAPVILRFATIFGVSPRTRFDLIINQFVREALSEGELMIYESNYSRSFVHVRDVVDAIYIALTAPEAKVRGEIYNVGGDNGNFTKDQIIELLKKHISGLKITYKQLSFEGDMRDVAVSFAKIRSAFNFVPRINVETGILEVRDAIKQGVIKDTLSASHRNASFITQ